ncbi:hypothetical protein OG225_42895 (plasmid) [Nocardia sp. NBC_01377]
MGVAVDSDSGAFGRFEDCAMFQQCGLPDPEGVEAAVFDQASPLQ